MTDIQRGEQQQLSNVVLDSTKDTINEEYMKGQDKVLIIVITSY